MAVVEVSCHGCKEDYWGFIKRFHSDSDAFVAFLKAHGVLPVSVTCPECNKQCRFNAENHMFICGQWKKVAKTK